MAANKTSSVLEASLPKHWGKGQTLKNTLIYALVRMAVGAISLTPFALARAFAVALGHLAASLPLRERSRARRQLREAFPDWSDAEVRRTCRRMFVHLAISAIEMVHADRFMEGGGQIALTEPQRRLIDEALSQGNGVVAVSGHIGNWELLAQRLAAEGFPVCSIAKPLYDPRLTRWVHRIRSARGQKILWRGDGSTSREMLRVFKKGEILALLIDQDTKVQGAFVPFFGKAAHTPTAAASLALRFNAPLLVGWLHRSPEGHRLHLERLLPEPDEDDVALTARLNERLEAAIRQAPEQWVWLHDRWRQKMPSPNEKQD